jgi:murein L,D-transpeptidase YafK
MAENQQSRSNLTGSYAHERAGARLRSVCCGLVLPICFAITLATVLVQISCHHRSAPPWSVDRSALEAERRAARQQALRELQTIINRQPVPWGSQIFIRIFKEEATLEVWAQHEESPFRLVRIYPVCSFSGELGPKLREGDRQSPEGFYFASEHQNHQT